MIYTGLETRRQHANQVACHAMPVHASLVACHDMHASARHCTAKSGGSFVYTIS